MPQPPFTRSATPSCRSREPRRLKVQVVTASAGGSNPQQRRKGTQSPPDAKVAALAIPPRGYIEAVTGSDSSKSRLHQQVSAPSNSPRTPSFFPIPNRDTSKGVDLEALPCDPQLRQLLPWQRGVHRHPSSAKPRNGLARLGHDLLFDPGLALHQARSGRTLLGPTIPREFECHVHASHGTNSIAPWRLCDFRPPPHATIVILPNSPPKTLRTVSRIRRHLFSELLKVLLSVIQLPQSCFGGGHPASITKAIWMCFDVLEFSKLGSARFIHLEASPILISNLAAAGRREQLTLKPPPSPLAFPT
jgi:hypothetical protein